MSDISFDEIARELEKSDQFRVLRKHEIQNQYYSNNEDKKLIGDYVDVETTGLNQGSDKIIELALVSFEFLSDGRIFKILDKLDEFEDPGFPIPEAIVNLTGITDQMVQGKQIDRNAVSRIVESASVVIAHNANFDRQFLESSFPVFEKKAWACSMRDIPWSEEGVESSKLEYIAYKLGFFFDGHRAINDCLAGIHVLSMPLPISNSPALKALLDNARIKEYRIWAEGSPFDAKDMLKSRGYRWSSGEGSNPKSWYVDVPGEKLEEEIGFLHSDIYKHEVELKVDIINAFNRYSDRI